MYAHSLQLVKRRVSLLLALVCLWLSAGAVLAHTDDFSFLRTFNVARGATERHAAAPIKADQCGACEWTQTARAVQTPVIAVETSTLIRTERPLPVPSALHLVPFTDILLRGPPTSLS